MNNGLKTIFSLTCLICLSILTLDAAEPLKPVRTNLSPVIDGILDDPIWKNVTRVTDFKTFLPDFGKDGSQITIGYAAYDSENLYFAYRCFDTEPDKIKTSINSRDNIIQDDWVCINLDSFNDQQALTAFYINPNGIQADSKFSAGNEDFNGDLVWYSAGKLIDSGYIVEVQIPLKSLRYSDKEPVIMSVMFERYISRFSEHSSFPELDPAKGMSILTQMVPLEYSGIKHYTLLELLPAVTYSYKSTLEKNRLVKDESKPDLSLTMKYGITSDLVLDGTLNPDFSQIESDAGQVDVNLRYDLFYAEKRPFFLEGYENFRIAATQASELDPVVSLVHTRTIVNPIAGIKLTGKINKNNTISSIYAADELPDEFNIEGKYSHVPIVRVKSALSDDSYIGGLAASVEKKDSYNRVIGLDEMYRLGDESMLESHFLGSFSKYTGAGDKINGHALGINYSKSTRDLGFGVSVKEISKDFAADMGYINRTGIFSFTGLIRPRYYPKSDFFQFITFEVFTGQTKDKYSNLWETFNHVSIQPYFLGSLTAKAKYSYSTEIFRGEKFKTGGFHFLFGGQFSKEFNASILYRHINSIYYERDPLKNPFQGVTNRITVAALYQPFDQLSAEANFIFSDFHSTSGEKLYRYPLYRGKLTYQLNKYLFFRGIAEYNEYKKILITDFLASFTYIPGTVAYLGYGSMYEKINWNEDTDMYDSSNRFLESARGLFFKMSYLWRL
ncbi:MAG: carbohydrate binding family 9 domain-containing protein [Ignavibacteriales bacterium]|nr:carbohydrate binding family 9 domain-containing protein [Ignavibacteriales bacterium]